MSKIGGARVGAGRPPVVGSARWKRAQRRAQRNGGAPPAPPVAVAKPTDLSPAQSAVWDSLAPLAIAQRTLTPSMVWYFRDLCEAIVLKRDMLAVIEADGLMQNRLSTKMDEDGGGEQVFESKAHPLIAKWTALYQRVEGGLTRFRLAPMGKEIAPTEPAKDEWSEFDAPLTIVQGGKR